MEAERKLYLWTEVILGRAPEWWCSARRRAASSMGGYLRRESLAAQTIDLDEGS